MKALEVLDITIFVLNSLKKFKKLKERLKCIFKVPRIQHVPYSNIICHI